MKPLTLLRPSFVLKARHASQRTYSQLLRPQTVTSLQPLRRPAQPRLQPLPQHSFTRSYSGLLDAATGSTYETLTYIHYTTGLSWALTLPLAALLIRTVIILPISLYSHKQTNKILQVNTLLHGWRVPTEKRVMAANRQLGPAACQKLLVREMGEKRKELYKTFGVRPGASIAGTLAQLPVWLVVIETLRKMCGTREGLLGLASHAWQSEPETGVTSIAQSVPLVPEFAVEGALWFPDLLVGDPQLVLPFVLSGVLFGNVYTAGLAAKSQGFERGKWSTRIQRVLLMVSIAAGPLMLHVPSALLVYWIMSAGGAWVQRILLDWWIPRPITASPCKRLNRTR